MFLTDEEVQKKFPVGTRVGHREHPKTITGRVKYTKKKVVHIWRDGPTQVELAYSYIDLIILEDKGEVTTHCTCDLYTVIMVCGCKCGVWEREKKNV